VAQQRGRDAWYSDYQVRVANREPRLRTGRTLMTSPQLQTERLVLRQWNDEDLWDFVEMNADAEVMEFFPPR